MLDKIKKMREYLDYIEEHYNNVQRAWGLLRPALAGEYFLNKNQRLQLDHDIKNHDISKLSAEEFCQYRESFFPTPFEKATVSQDVIDENFDSAWEHHKRENNHHWEHWMNLDCDKAGMLIHTFCDWYAMSMKFGGKPLDYYRKQREAGKAILPELEHLMLLELEVIIL